jgi:hypothetical protein
MASPTVRSKFFQNKAGVPACDQHAMAGKRATKRKANISKVGYGSVELVRHLGAFLPEH